MLGDNIRKLRKERKWTLEYLSALINVNFKTLSQYERNLREPALQTLTALTKVFNVTLEELIGEGENGMSLEIVKTIVLSTNHVSLDTAKWLDGHTEKGIVVYQKGEVGWLIPLWENLINEIVEDKSNPKSTRYPNRRDVPDDLLNVLKFAEEHGCKWIMFDRDADLVDDLEEFDW
jgi:transcriptional regulator with XRE-family HTH domain